MATASVAPYSDSWRERYAKSRYLEFLSVDDLQKRYVDLLDNVLAFTSDGRPHLGGLSGDTDWTRRVADVWAEADLRSIGPAWLKAVEHTVLDRPYANIKRAMDAWGDRRFTPERALIKYGHRDHMVDLLERGRLRLTPASNYDDPSLNPAIRDAELEFPVHLPPGTRLQVELEPGSKVFHDIPGIAGLITQTSRCENYYVFCASATFDPRAFDEFGYDACVLIHDWEKLIELIKVQRVPARSLSAGATVYLDPFMPHRSAPSVQLMKHLRYEYQREWRIFWTDPLPPPPLQPYFVDLGNLSSFCELITL